MTRQDIRLANFHGCGWDTVPLAREAVVRSERLLAANHPSHARVISCQRLEAYGESPCACPADERWSGQEALRHLAEVAAGLHSIVLGESQILGQARAAFEGANAGVRSLGDLALASARELRAQTHFNSHAGALLDKGLRLAGASADGRILVLGPGQMGRLVALRAEALGFSEIWLAGRTLPAIAGSHPRVRPALLADFPAMPAFDCITGCLGSAADEIGLDGLPQSPLILDLGTPRNFAGRRPGSTLITLRELVADEQSRPHAVHRREALRAELGEIVSRRLERWLETGESTIGRIRERAERLRVAEVERTVRLHPGADREVIEAMSQSLINRILHVPTERLRSHPDLQPHAAALFLDASDDRGTSEV